MTPPRLDKVDIRDLSSLHLEHLVSLKPSELKPRLFGADLSVDASSGRLRRLVNGKPGEFRGLEEDVAWVQTLRAADANSNGFLELEEVRTLLRKQLSPEAAATVDPGRFLASVGDLMRLRYRPLARNMAAWAEELAVAPLLDALQVYADGLHHEELRQARSVFPLNALHKSLGNAFGWLPQNLVRRPLASLVARFRGKPASPLAWFPADAAAERSALARKADREQALETLRRALRSPELAGLPASRRLDAAIARIRVAAPQVAECLVRDLAALRLQRILELPDAKHRHRALLDFAKSERPGPLGFGSGNTRLRHFWNYTGARHNLYFARSVLKFLGSKAASDDAAFDKTLQKEAREQRLQMLGQGGGFTNLAVVGLSHLFTAFGKLGKPVPYRRWADEDVLDVVGRSLNAGLTVYGGGKTLTALGELRGLARLRGYREAFGLWSQDVKRGSLSPLATWRAARLTAEREAELLSASGIELETATTRLGKSWGRLKKRLGEKLLGNLPALSAAQQAGLRNLARLPQKPLDKFVKGVVLLGIAQYSDKKLQAPFNPFLTRHELSLERYPDPTRPLPELKGARGAPRSTSKPTRKLNLLKKK